MPDFLYPTTLELNTVAQELVPRLVAARPIFDILPLREVDSHLLEWEQRDNYIGLQQVRGLNGAPKRVVWTGGKRYAMQPGVYGEFKLIDEQQLTNRRAWGQVNGGPINVADLVMEAQTHLLGRRLDRIEYIGWTLLITGTFSVADGSSVLHTDSFTTQTYAAGVAWGTAATSTPLADMRAIQLKGRGYSLDFGSRAKAYMNRTTFNQMMSNTNASDLGGKKGIGLQSITGLGDVNRILSAEGLVEIVIYDEGYINDSGTWTLYIPNNKVLVIGARTDGDPIGEYRMTRNANNPGMGPGPYMKVVDDERDVPRTIVVHDGHNGGPVLFHPAAAVVMTV